MTARLAIVLTLAASCAPAAAPEPTPVTAPPAPPEPTTTTTAAAPTTTAPAPVTTAAPAPVPPPTRRVRAAPAPPPPPGGAGAGDIVAAICAAWGDECGRAVAVARCESGLRPNARNGPHAGLFQIATRVHAARIARMGFTPEQMFEVGPNIAVAHALWVEQGWRPWTCAR